MEAVDSVVGVWWAVYVKSRAEKAFVGDLEADGIPAYVPLTQRWGSHDNKRVMIHEPTFKGYAFFAGRGCKSDESYADDLYAVKGNSRVVQLIEIRDQKLFVRQLAQIQRALEINPALGSCMYMIAGTRVRVVKGDFLGMEGILERNNKGVLHVPLSIMGMSVEVEFGDESYLEPLN